MKKNLIKLLVGLSILGLAITGCSKNSSNDDDNSNPSNPSGPGEVTPEGGETLEDKRYAIYLLAVESGYTGTYEEWLASIKGEKGDKGDKGDNGTNGTNGENGKDGLTPYIGENGNWWIGTTDLNVKAQGEQGVSVSSVVKTDTLDNVDTYTITLSNGNISTFTVTNGVDGSNGKNGENGQSAYELYLQAHPEYVGDEDKWLDDLINGRLGNKAVHTVTFDANNGESIDPQYIEHGEKISRPSDPQKDGYTFDCWSYMGEPWLFYGSSVTEDMELSALYSALTYDLYFLNDDGSTLYHTYVEYNTNYESHWGFGDPTCSITPSIGELYVFTGWEVSVSHKDSTVTLTATYRKDVVDTLGTYVFGTYNQLFDPINEPDRVYTVNNLNHDTEMKIYFGEDRVALNKINVTYDYDTEVNYRPKAFDNKLFLMNNITSMTFKISKVGDIFNLHILTAVFVYQDSASSSTTKHKLYNIPDGYFDFANKDIFVLDYGYSTSFKKLSSIDAEFTVAGNTFEVDFVQTPKGTIMPQFELIENVEGHVEKGFWTTIGNSYTDYTEDKNHLLADFYGIDYSIYAAAQIDQSSTEVSFAEAVGIANSLADDYLSRELYTFEAYTVASYKDGFSIGLASSATGSPQMYLSKYNDSAWGRENYAYISPGSKVRITSSLLKSGGVLYATDYGVNFDYVSFLNVLIVEESNSTNPSQFGIKFSDGRSRRAYDDSYRSISFDNGLSTNTIVRRVKINKGDSFQLYDFTYSAGWTVNLSSQVDSRSFRGLTSSMLKVSGSYFVAQQTFIADIGIYLQDSNDYLYFQIMR